MFTGNVKKGWIVILSHLTGEFDLVEVLCDGRFRDDGFYYFTYHNYHTRDQEEWSGGGTTTEFVVKKIGEVE